jgi:hypothetical protein
MPEASVHLLVEFSFIRALWQLILGHCHPPMPAMRVNSDVKLLDQRSVSAYSVPEPHWRALSSLLQLVWWSSWKGCNQRVFRSKAISF